jgi:hypothetical protein
MPFFIVTDVETSNLSNIVRMHTSKAVVCPDRLSQRTWQDQSIPQDIFPSLCSRLVPWEELESARTWG